MKGIYWRPQRTSSTQLAVVAAFSLLGLLLVERFPITARQPLYDVKMRAARTAQKAFEQIGLERIRLGVPVDPEVDPTGSGLIGPEDSPISSKYGHLPAKQTSINPNFAAVAVELLRRAGVQEGDVVAVGVSGSFPALNACVYIAIETMGAEPVVIVSLSASEFGATHPELTWLDMERVLYERGLIGTRAVAASLGGVADRAVGHTKRGRELLEAAIRRNGRPQLEAETLAESVDERLRVIEAATGGRPVAAYVNIGGGTASMGTEEDRERYLPGINRTPPPGANPRSVAGELLETGAPAINFTHIEDLARRFGLPQQPLTAPVPGEGRVFIAPAYSQVAAVVVLVLIVAGLYAVTRLDVGFRIAGGGGGKSSSGRAPPEQMV